MINRDDIEVGDKCYTRDGGCLVARQVGETIMLGDCGTAKWVNGKFLAHDIEHPLDIIRIEKAPKPVVEEVYLGLDDGEWKVVYDPHHWDKSFKLTIINGKLDKAEQVK